MINNLSIQDFERVAQEEVEEGSPSEKYYHLKGSELACLRIYYYVIDQLKLKALIGVCADGKRVMTILKEELK
jgi:hypothetical protein